ncbi:MAG: hypothetical protein ACXVH2_11370 [Methanobacterium sp.]
MKKSIYAVLIFLFLFFLIDLPALMVVPVILTYFLRLRDSDGEISV